MLVEVIDGFVDVIDGCVNAIDGCVDAIDMLVNAIDGFVDETAAGFYETDVPGAWVVRRLAAVGVRGRLNGGLGDERRELVKKIVGLVKDSVVRVDWIVALQNVTREVGNVTREVVKAIDVLVDVMRECQIESVRIFVGSVGSVRRECKNFCVSGSR